MKESTGEFLVQWVALVDRYVIWPLRIGFGHILVLSGVILRCVGEALLGKEQRRKEDPND